LLKFEKNKIFYYTRLSNVYNLYILINIMDATSCPICKTMMDTIPGRYFNVVCNECIDVYGMYDENGNSIKFGNIDISGGLKSITTNKDNGSETVGDSNICYINGFQCIAQEARFGGIVIQCCENTSKRRRR
tara:strand:- start:10 stop:405 length:396 start_codon:yes stop_codon:yes gene_type:complete